MRSLVDSTVDVRVFLDMIGSLDVELPPRHAVIRSILLFDAMSGTRVCRLGRRLVVLPSIRVAVAVPIDLDERESPAHVSARNDFPVALAIDNELLETSRLLVVDRRYVSDVRPVGKRSMTGATRR